MNAQIKYSTKLSQQLVRGLKIIHNFRMITHYLLQSYSQSICLHNHAREMCISLLLEQSSVVSVFSWGGGG